MARNRGIGKYKWEVLGLDNVSNESVEKKEGKRRMGQGKREKRGRSGHKVEWLQEAFL